MAILHSSILLLDMFLKKAHKANCIHIYIAPFRKCTEDSSLSIKSQTRSTDYTQTIQYIPYAAVRTAINIYIHTSSSVLGLTEWEKLAKDTYLKIQQV